jgi:uncharacterized protein (TIRG00374 family)
MQGQRTDTKENTSSSTGMVFVVLGVSLVAYLIWRNDPALLLEHLNKVGWLFVVAGSVHLIQIVLMARAWYFSMSSKSAADNFPAVLRAYWFGHAINGITPVKSLGDILAGISLKNSGVLDVKEMVSSLVIQNILAVVVTAIFVLIGALVSLFYDFPSSVVLGILAGSTMVVLPILVLVPMLRMGLASRIIRVIRKIPCARIKDPERLLKKAEAIDQIIRSYPKEQSKRFHQALACWMSVRLLQIVEAWVLMIALMPQTGAGQLFFLAVLIQAVQLIVGGVFSFVPGQVGVHEGSSTFMFSVIGLDPLSGLSMELVRRVIKMIGILIGFCCRATITIASYSGWRQVLSAYEQAQTEEPAPYCVADNRLVL